MTNDQQIAVVTGANRGIGLEICRQLAGLNYQVILTSRDEAKGRAACEEFVKHERTVTFHPLDVDHAVSINTFSEYIKDKFGRCDCLVNNAGIFPDARDSSSSDGWPSIFTSHIDTIRDAMTTNVYGPILLAQALVPLMKKHSFGRIVNISSGMGQLSEMNGHCPGYRISKTSLNAVTRIMADELKEMNILVNCMCPGWVKTDMGGPNATRPVEKGAETAVWLATLPNGGPTGKFFRDKQEFPW